MSARRRYSQHQQQNTAPKKSLLSFLLDPIDWLSETIYSVLIALLFTLAYRILMLEIDYTEYFTSGYGTDLFIAILAAVTAGGIIDGLMYAMFGVFERNDRYRLLQHLQIADTEETAVEAVADELDYLLEPITSEDQRQELYLDVFEHLLEGEKPTVGLQREDVVGALVSAVVAILAVLPSLLPLLLLPDNTALAIRISNVISIMVLFVAGYSWGKHTHTNPWWSGMLVTSVGLIIVLVAFFLGG